MVDAPAAAELSPCSSNAISQSASGSPSAPTGTEAVGADALDDGAPGAVVADDGSLGVVAGSVTAGR